MSKKIIKKLIEKIVLHNYQSAILRRNKSAKTTASDSIKINIVISEKKASNNVSEAWDAKIPRYYYYNLSCNIPVIAKMKM